MNKIVLIFLILTNTFSYGYGQKVEKLIRKGNGNLKIAHSKDVSQEKKNDALNKSYLLYRKVIIQNRDIINDSAFKENMDTLISLLTNRCVSFYNKAETTGEIELYEMAANQLIDIVELDSLLKREIDTILKRPIMMYYTAVMFQKAKKYQKSKEIYNFCIAEGYEKGDPYQGLSSLYKETGDSINELEILKVGYKKYPNSSTILNGLINYYMNLGNSENCFKLLEKAIEIDPENPTFYFAKGTLYGIKAKDENNNDSSEYFENEAVDLYNKAIQLDSGYSEALYNLGVIYYNQAAHLLHVADVRTFDVPGQYQRDIEQSNFLFKLSLPYFEKVHLIDNKDESIIKCLIMIYQKLQLYEQKEVARKVLDGEVGYKITPVSDIQNLIYKEKNKAIDKD